MSYDTTVNDAIDPPEARVPQPTLHVARYVKIFAIASIVLLLAMAAAGGWMLVR